MSEQVSHGSAGEYQADERAGVTRLRPQNGNVKLATNENMSVIELQCLSSKPTFYPLLCDTEFCKSINHFVLTAVP